jgi:hypothetical protein
VWFDTEDHKTKIFNGKEWIATPPDLEDAWESKKAAAYKSMRDEYATSMRKEIEHTMYGEYTKEVEEARVDVVYGMDGIPRMIRR